MKEKPIARLSEELIGKIAAGEVVENPSSAIKEMVENSLDAGASAITVEIRDGGIAFMRVTDNGCGIRAREIRMAFERHATSKISTLGELYEIETLGFRGEALASIAAVAKMTMTTRHAGEEIGTRVINEGGQIRSIDEAACPQGTTIVVRDLFFNTPVRLKFLKRPATEGSKVAEMMAKMILSRPDVAFKLISNGKTVYQSSGNGTLRSAVYTLYGRETAGNMVEVHAEGAVSVSGLVGVGMEARANRARQTFIVNGRAIRSPLLSQALEDGARERYTIGHYPICVLQLQMPPTLVDVNVHPNKLEVRFSDEHLIYEKVSAAVHDAFSVSPLSGAPNMLENTQERAMPARVSVISTDTEQGIALAAMKAGQRSETDLTAVQSVRKEENVQKQTQVREQEVSREQPDRKAEENAKEDADGKEELPVRKIASASPSFNEVVRSFFGGSPAPAASFERTITREEPERQGVQTALPISAPEEEPLSEYAYIGVAFDTYVLLQNKKQLLMIDQHAAHERILYEKLMREVDTGGGSQLLLVPQVVHVTPQEADKLETYAAEIRDAGYEVEPFGGDSYQIRAVPNVLGVPESKEAFLEMVDRLGELRVLSTRQKRRDAILQMACKKAVKGGEKLSMDEIRVLIREMQRTGAPPTCPHGRPLVVILQRTELEKRFKRINE